MMEVLILEYAQLHRQNVSAGRASLNDNVLADTINGSYKAEVIHRRSWPSREAVELARLGELVQPQAIARPDRGHSANRGRRSKLLSSTERVRQRGVTHTNESPGYPADAIVKVSDRFAFFSPEEAEVAQQIMDEFCERIGGDAVIDSAYPHFMRAARHGA